MKCNISIIIPFFNERENINNLVSELNNYVPILNKVKIEVKIEDDGSTDDSLEILKN